MADMWTLVTPSGDYQLNASFSAPRLHPGGVDTNAALRRDGRTTYQRSGDGLRTPGPLILRGRVWRDDQDVSLIVAELEDIRDAVASCIEVKRFNDAGVYTYEDLAGGPPPKLIPDGLGGWEVEIELWPGRADPSFLPNVGTYEFRYWLSIVSGVYPVEEDYATLLNAESSQTVAETLSAATINRTNDAPAGESRGFGCIVTGVVVPAYSETYTIHLEVDDIARLYLDGSMILDADEVGEHSVAVALQASRSYRLRVEWLQSNVIGGVGDNPNRLKLEWESASQTLELIPG